MNFPDIAWHSYQYGIWTAACSQVCKGRFFFLMTSFKTEVIIQCHRKKNAPSDPDVDLDHILTKKPWEGSAFYKETHRRLGDSR